MSSYSIFHLEGGLGKHIEATAVAKCIKNNHPQRKLIVICAYPEESIKRFFCDNKSNPNNSILVIESLWCSTSGIKLNSSLHI